MSRTRGRFVPALLLVLLSPACPDAAPVWHVEDVFPPDVVLCPGAPPAADAEGPEARASDRYSVPAPELDARDLRTVRWLGVEARPLSDPVPLVVEDGVVGITVRAETPEPGWDVSVELYSESGALLACEDCPGAPVAGEVRNGRGTVQMPSTDRPGGALVPGTYSFRVRATPVLPGSGETSGGVTVDVFATFRSNVAVRVERRLDLNFVFLPGSTLSADIARTSPRFRDFLDRVAQWFEPTGIRLGNISYVDLDRPEFDVVTTWGQAGRMFRTSAEVGRPRALNVYCVRKFDSPLNPVVGLSGGIPGPVLNGTRDSGIAIRMEPFFICSDCLGAYASLMAHEIGHYLGFYHTTEADLRHWDPMLDTPECTTDFPYGCGDYPYVMFPLIHSANRVWSPAQTDIARTHPMVRTVAVVRGAPSDDPPVRVQAALGPNPFEGSIRFGLATPLAGGVTVHDVAGRVVRRIAAPSGTAEWDGRAEDGRVLPAGVYFARFREAGSVLRTVRIVKSR